METLKLYRKIQYSSLIALGALFIGCVGIPKEQQAQNTAALVQVSAQLGTTIAIKEDPNCRPYFVTAKTMIDLALANGDYDPDRLRQTLRELSIKELHDETIIEAINAALNLYTLTYQNAVAQKLNTNVWCKPILAALSSGIGSSLNVKAVDRRVVVPDSNRGITPLPTPVYQTPTYRTMQENGKWYLVAPDGTKTQIMLEDAIKPANELPPVRYN